MNPRVARSRWLFAGAHKSHTCSCGASDLLSNRVEPRKSGTMLHNSTMLLHIEGMARNSYAHTISNPNSPETATVHVATTCYHTTVPAHVRSVCLQRT